MVLNEVKSFPSSTWPDFSEKKFVCTIVNCSNSFASSPDKLLWGQIKRIIKDKLCLKNIISIVSACLRLGYWPNHFKNQ